MISFLLSIFVLILWIFYLWESFIEKNMFGVATRKKGNSGSPLKRRRIRFRAITRMENFPDPIFWNIAGLGRPIFGGNCRCHVRESFALFMDCDGSIFAGAVHSLFFQVCFRFRQ